MWVGSIPAASVHHMQCQILGFGDLHSANANMPFLVADMSNGHYGRCHLIKIVRDDGLERPFIWGVTSAASSQSELTFWVDPPTLALCSWACFWKDPQGQLLCWGELQAVPQPQLADWPAAAWSSSMPAQLAVRVPESLSC